MKKVIRILGVTLSVLVLASCSKDDEPDNSLPVVTPSSLSGSYKVTGAVVATPIDTNKDGYFTNYLLEDGYNACGFDNTIEITQTTFSIIKKGVSCTTDEKNEIYEYKFNQTSKTIDLYENGKVIETITSVHFNDDPKILLYRRYDPILKQEIAFNLTK